jgi:hypothetical protein
LRLICVRDETRIAGKQRLKFDEKICHTIAIAEITARQLEGVGSANLDVQTVG